jgi:cysteine-rich repeat protein
MSRYHVALATALLLTACGDDSSVTASDSASASGTGTTDATTDATQSPTGEVPTTSDSDSNSNSNSGSSGDPACTPGEQQDCSCSDDQPGVQTCDPAGDGFGPCECPEAACGDGEINGSEVCDDGTNDGSYGGCAPDCSALGPRCQDAIVNGSEACDDGNPVDGDGCNVDCILSGSELWTQYYPGDDAGDARAHGAAVDAEGNVIIVGEEFVVGQNANAWARKYSPAGDILWSYAWNGETNGTDILYAVAVTPDNDLVMVGETNVAGNGADMLFLKLGPDSKPVWQRTQSGGTSFGDRAFGVAVDPQGNIAVTGEAYKLIGLHNVWTGLLDPDGVEIWSDNFDANAGNDAGNAVAFTADGDLIVAGNIYVPIGLADLWLRKYSAAGKELWTRSADHMKGNDLWHGVAIDSEGNIGLSGEVYEVEGLSAILTAKYSASGFELWSQIQDSDGGDNDIGHGVAFDLTGNLISVGEEYTANDFARAWVRKYDPEGGELWTQIHDGVDAGNDIARAVAIDKTGNIYAAGEEYRVGQFADVWLTKYAP